MKDIPAFTAAGGAATLVLSQIPTKRKAYVMAWQFQPERLEALLREAAAFCRMAGAQKVYCAAGCALPFLPHAFDLVRLTVRRADLPALQAPVPLEPLDAENAPRFLEFYNTLLGDLDGAVTYDRRDIDRILSGGKGFLALVDGRYAGIGEVRENQLHTLGVLPAYRGLGARLALTLLRETDGETLQVQTASTNRAALRLYEKLGFRERDRAPRWYLCD